MREGPRDDPPRPPLRGLVAAEVVASHLPAPDGSHPTAEGIVLGMVLHTATLFLLLGHAAVFSARGSKAQANFLAALSAVPLSRIFSLSLPFFIFTIVQWLLLISVPLLIVFFTLIRVLGESLGAVGLRGLRARDVPFQAGVAASGVALGVMEYAILRPSEAWIPALIPTEFVLGAIAIALSSGVAEEVIFRGILLYQGRAIATPRAAVLMVTALFAVMHFGFLPPSTSSSSSSWASTSPSSSSGWGCSTGSSPATARPTSSSTSSPPSYWPASSPDRKAGALTTRG